MRISDWSSDVCSSDLSQDRHVHRVPIDRRFLAVNQTMLIKVKKQRLFVAVIFRFAGGEFAGPVEREAKLLQLRAHGCDILARPASRMHILFHGCVLSGHAEGVPRSEEHTSELQSLMRISYAVFCLKKKKHTI